MKLTSNSFNLAGTEQKFEEMFNLALKERTTTHFQYLEIGIAAGATLVAVADHLKSVFNSSWRATGIDLWNGLYFNLPTFLDWAQSHDVFVSRLGIGRQTFISEEHKNDIQILLLPSDDQRALISPGCVNFAVIDGCHGFECVRKDFLSIERGIADRGIVAFHDAGIEEQGTSYQPHCREPIAVEQALLSIGLEMCDHCRSGWTWIGYAQGDKTRNGNSFAFFQRVKEKEIPYQEGFSG